MVMSDDSGTDVIVAAPTRHLIHPAERLRRWVRLKVLVSSQCSFAPKGRLRARSVLNRSFGTRIPFLVPGVETPGYCQMPFRDRASDMSARHF